MRDDYRRSREGYDPSDYGRGNDEGYGSHRGYGQQQGRSAGERGRGSSRSNENWGSEPDEDFRENVGYGNRASQWGERGDRAAGGDYDHERHGNRDFGGRDRNFDFGRSDEGGPYGYGEGRFGQKEGWGGQNQHGDRDEGGGRYGRTGYRASSYGSSHGGGGRSGGEYGGVYGGRSSGGGGEGSPYGGGRTYGGGEYGYGRGERSSASRSMPKNYQRSDERIRDDVCEQLSRSGYDVANVSVDVSDGKVTLEGTVHDRYTKHAIEDCADDSMGVKEVDNRIRVSREGGESHTEEQNRQSSTGSHPSSGQGSTSASPKKRI